LSAYAGPMPFSVVPILSSPRIASAIASWAWCHGKIRWARLDTLRSLHEMPRASSVSTSLNRVGRSTTTPLPMTGTTWSYSTPLGTSCNAYRSVPTTTVCPAL
jgi:hypothetical protein